MSSVMEKATVEIPDELQPVLRSVGWRVLVCMPEARKESEAGIVIPEKTAEREALAAMVAQVVWIGEDCYPESKYPNGPWCGVGDWVIFRSYSGTPFKFRGRDYRLLNDDAIEAVTVVPYEVTK